MISFLFSEQFSSIATILSLFGDIAILILTFYTFYLTTTARKLKLTSSSFSSSTFFGNKISFSIMNKSLHAIPVQNVFILKRTRKKDFAYMDVASYDDPLTINSWTIKSIESAPFTSIMGYKGSKEWLVNDAVIGVTYANKTLWLKPYKKAPLWAAKRAYRKHNFQTMSVSRTTMEGKTISENVDCIIQLRVKDSNNQTVIRTIYGITHFNNEQSVLLSEDIKGHTALCVPGENKEEIIRALIQMGFTKNDVSVQIIGRSLLE